MNLQCAARRPRWRTGSRAAMLQVKGHGTVLAPHRPAAKITMPSGGAASPAAQPPRYGLAWFRISFGRLQLKAYAKGEQVLRFETTVHNTKELRCRRSLDNFAQIITCWPRWQAGSSPCGTAPTSDSCPTASSMSCRFPPRPDLQVTGIDLNKPRIRTTRTYPGRWA